MDGDQLEAATSISVLIDDLGIFKFLFNAFYNDENFSDISLRTKYSNFFWNLYIVIQLKRIPETPKIQKPKNPQSRPKPKNLHLKSSFASSLGGRHSSKGIVRIFRSFLVFSKKK